MTVTLLDPAEAKSFTPSHYGEGAETPVYEVAALNWRETAMFRGDLIRAGAGFYPSDATVVAEVRACLVEVGHDNLPDLLARTDAFAALLAEEPAVPPAGTEAEPAAPEAVAAYDADRVRRLATIEAYRPIEAAMRSTSRVAALLAARAVHESIAPTMAAAHALRGWSDDVGLPFRRAGNTVPDNLLGRLPREDLAEIGDVALRLLR